MPFNNKNKSSINKMKGAFKMAGFNPGAGTKMGAAFMKEGPAYGGDGRTYSQAAKDSGGTDAQTNLDMIVKNQRAYEKRMKAENPNFNKREDNIWKKRQNKINELLGSSRRYEINENVKVRENQMNVPGTDDVRTKVMEKNEEGDKLKNVKRETVNEDGEKVLKMQKNVKKDDEGTKKLKEKFDDEGNLIRVKGYSTGKKREGAKAEKASKQKIAKLNRMKNRLKNLDPDSRRYKTLKAKIDEASSSMKMKYKK